MGLFNNEPAVSLSVHQAIIKDYRDLVDRLVRDRNFYRNAWVKAHRSAVNVAGHEDSAAQGIKSHVVGKTDGGGHSDFTTTAPPDLFADRSFGAGWTVDDKDFFDGWAAGMRSDGFDEEVIRSKWLRAYGNQSPVVALSV